MSFARGAAAFASRAVRSAAVRQRVANTTPRSPAQAGVGPGRPQSTASQAQRSLPSRLRRDAVKRRNSAARRSMMTHLPAALQRSLAWQSTLLFDWDGIDDR